MKIAVVGGGTRCLALLELVNKHAFHNLSTIVVAVADIKNDAPGFVKANKIGLFTTNDYNDLFDRDDIDLIVELTGNKNIFIDILSKKKDDVWAISHRIAVLFWDIGAISAQEDIKNKLEKIRLTHRIFNVLINEMIQEDIMVIGSDYRILNMNETLLKKVGMEREEVIGQYCYQITHKQNVPCSGEDHKCPLIQTLKTHKPSKETHIHKDKNDEDVYYSISTYPIFEKNEVVGAIEVARDITPDINAKQTMMQHDKLASIGRLSAGVAHEINNPLTTILTTSMLMQEEIDHDDPLYQELEIITSEALRCRKIVASLLEFSRQTNPEKKLYNINKIITACVALTRKQAAFKDLSITQNIDEDIPRTPVDKDQIQQALINLILNALDATESGGKISVSSKFISSDKRIEIAISDTGKGIDEEVENKIFEPFFTTKEGGTGLGLAITHGIIQRHGGTINVKNRQTQGVTFTISLPINKGNQNGNR